MYSKIKSIVSEFVAEHDLASKAKMDENFLTDMLTVRLFDGLSQKESAAPRPSRNKPKENKPEENQTNLLNLVGGGSNN